MAKIMELVHKLEILDSEVRHPMFTRHIVGLKRELGKGVEDGDRNGKKDF